MIFEQNVLLSDKNWFSTGGKSCYFCEPTDVASFSKALEFSEQQNLKIFVLGEGANILISDDGFDGLVIRPRLQQIELGEKNGSITVGAGVSIQDVIDYALDNGLVGLEEFSGIPGTVGGSMYINIHYFQYLLSDYVISACVIEKKTKRIFDVDKDWFNFCYNSSTLQQGDYYLLSATFQLKKVDSLQSAYAKGRRDEIIRHRNNRYPASNTCGSFFRNFHEEELSFLINGKKVPYVAYYLDKVGVKGHLRVGKAVVSYRHANMLVAEEGATTADVIALARKMQELVYEKFGIVPQPECRLVGFKEYPVHKKV